MRLFFALWPPTEVAKALDRLAHTTTGQWGGLPTRSDTLHLTLAFLGEIPENKMPLLIEAAQGIKARPFELNLNSLGYWHHNRLLWAGSSTPPAALFDLADHLRGVLSKAGFVVQDAGRPFAPHVTLVRKLPANCAPLDQPIRTPTRWPCSEFALVRSKRSESGPAYENIAEFPLTEP